MGIMINVNDMLPLMQRAAEFLDGKESGVDHKKPAHTWLKTLKQGCLTISSFAIIVRTIVAFARTLASILSVVFWIGVTLSVITVAINACWIVISREKRNQLTEAIQGLVNSMKKLL